MRRRRRDSSRLPIWKAHSFRPVDKLNNSSKRRYRCCRDAYTAESYSSRYINLFFLYTVDGAPSKERHVDFWDTCREGPRPLECPHRDPERTKTEEDCAVVGSLISAWPSVNINPGFIFFCSKAFPRIIFSVILSHWTHGLRPPQGPSP